MSPVEALVIQGEEVRWSGRPRLMAVLPAAIAGLGLFTGAIAVFAIAGVRLPLVFVPVGLALPVWGYLVVTRTRFVVTDRAVYRKTGVLSRSVRRIGLERVQNSSFRQGVRGTLFGYGTVAIQAAGGGEIRFHDVEDPREVRSLVDRRAGDTGTVPGSVEQWKSVLETVKGWRSALDSAVGGDRSD